LGLWVLSVFLPVTLCTPSFDSEFLRVVSNSGCRLVKPNHLNLGVVCDYFLLSSYYSHLTGLERNKIYFLTYYSTQVTNPVKGNYHKSRAQSHESSHQPSQRELTQIKISIPRIMGNHLTAT
jgi:hypothetical protein